jgi:predicted N-acetyltransferase YhbS
MITFRELTREEIEQVWTIDRREVVENVYHLENNVLVLKPEHYDMQGWPPGEPELYTPHLYKSFDRGGWFCGAFEGNLLVGAAVLDNKFIGKQTDALQLKFLHVSRDYRGQGLGIMLFDLAREKARERGAKRLYISATPSENTVNFYVKRGAVVTDDPDPELFELEPEDIHFLIDIESH